MADAYVDFEQTASTSESPYDTWAKAAADIQTALTQAGVGGRVFVRIDGDGVGTTKDTAAAGRILAWPGDDQVPSGVYGVKDATTNAPPVDSDLCVRGTDTLPVFECTGAGNDITVDELSANNRTTLCCHGIRFEAVDIFKVGADCVAFFYDCEFNFLTFGTSTNGQFFAWNCDFVFNATGAHIKLRDGLILFAYGGVLSGSVPTILFDANNNGSAKFFGVDCSIVVGTLMDLTSTETVFAELSNCKLGTGVARVTGTGRQAFTYISLVGCSDETGLGTGEAVRDYAQEWFRGTVLNEATFIRTGGSNDSVAGFSYALTPKTASTKEGLFSIWTPWFGGLVVGDATTSKDFTIYIANSSGADLTEADVWVELFFPSEAGTANHGLDLSSKASIDASASDVTNDAVSDWSTGAGGKNAQKIVVARTPDYTGPVYARVHFAQAGTTSLYVDPKVYVTDTP